MAVTVRGGVDEMHMERALALARQGRGQTSPNPMVGAVVVSDEGVVVGTGFHARAGEAHAEVRALDEAGGGARNGTLYCTLEPCAHTGRTGPCAPRIVDAGLRRVVIAIVDPHPRVAGAGAAYLRAHGLQVDVGVRRAAAARLNEVFLTWATRRRPFVIVKIATSIDGRIAMRAGTRTAITGEAAAAAVHRTRAEVDAIGVGSTTVLVDDPQLTARGSPRARPLARVVLDRRLRTPPAARVLRTLAAGPVLIVTTRRALRDRPAAADRLRAAGATIEPVENGTIEEAVTRLAELEVTSLLLEGGAAVHRAAWTSGVVDRVQRYIAPLAIGGDGVPWLDDVVSVARLGSARVERYGPDVLLQGDVQRSG